MNKNYQRVYRLLNHFDHPAGPMTKAEIDGIMQNVNHEQDLLQAVEWWEQTMDISMCFWLCFVVFWEGDTWQNRFKGRIFRPRTWEDEQTLQTLFSVFPQTHLMNKEFQFGFTREEIITSGIIVFSDWELQPFRDENEEAEEAEGAERAEENEENEETEEIMEVEEKEKVEENEETQEIEEEEVQNMTGSLQELHNLFSDDIVELKTLLSDHTESVIYIKAPLPIIMITRDPEEEFSQLYGVRYRINFPSFLDFGHFREDLFRFEELPPEEQHKKQFLLGFPNPTEKQKCWYLYKSMFLVLEKYCSLMTPSLKNHMIPMPSFSQECSPIQMELQSLILTPYDQYLVDASRVSRDEFLALTPQKPGEDSFSLLKKILGCIPTQKITQEVLDWNEFVPSIFLEVHSRTTNKPTGAQYILNCIHSRILEKRRKVLHAHIASRYHKTCKQSCLMI